MDFIVYLFKVNIAIVLFYGIFRLMFQSDTFFRWKRFALLAIIFISFLYPAINITRQIISNHQLSYVLETVSIPVYSMPEEVITGNTETAINLFPLILLAIYFVVAALLLIRVLIQFGTIIYKLRYTAKKVLFGHTVYESPGLKTPYSFFNWIVIDSSGYSEIELKEILLHEATHVEQRHSADTLLAELVCILCWFNPFAWLLRTEIRMNLEFLADRSVLSSGCGAEHYQFHLLRLSYQKTAVKITNNFNVSLLKKRIFMMNKKQTPIRSIWKYALILPVIALLLFFNSSFQTKAESENLTNIVLTDNEMNNEPQAPITNQDKRDVYVHVEQIPMFPGGDAALIKWIADHTVYPKVAQEQGIQGHVNVRFVVAPDGSVEDAVIVKGTDPSLDKEALRVVSSLPKFAPGKQNGKAVYVYYNVPVRFRLESSGNASSNTNIKATTQENLDRLGSDVVIEIDGKIVSQNEFKKFDNSKIQTLTLEKKGADNRIIITTKK